MKQQLIRVLLIEDNSADAEVVREMLEQAPAAPFEIEVVDRLDGGLQLLQRRDFDVILVDLSLPDSRGLDTFRCVQKSYPSYPVILMTGTEDGQLAEQAVKEGAQDYLIKGQTDPKLLDRSIRYAIERNRIRQENAQLFGELEAASRAKDEFLAMLSHELRTPLTAILGWAVLLRDGKLPAARAESALAAIEQNARVQSRIVDDLLDISRIITGKLNLRVGPIMLANVIQAVVDSVRVAAEAKQIRIDVDLDPGVPPLSGDSDRLQQVIWNLLSNSIKFTPRNGLIEIKLGSLDNQAEITVRDTGTGIPEQALPHIFERFRQADSTNSRQHGGLGLGLAIVRHLVEAHGGTVSASSSGPGQGSTFKILLPTISARQWHTAQSSLPRPSASARLDGISVLVVEDEIEHAALIQQILEQCGASVIVASNAEEGFQEFKLHHPDVLLTDIAMPAQDGYWLLKRIRDHEAGAAVRTPTAAITAYGWDEVKTRLLAASFDKYLAKPIDAESLIGLVSDLSQYSAKAKLRQKTG